MSSADIVFGAVLSLGLVWLSWFDWRTHRLPDFGTLPLMIAGLVWSHLFGPNFTEALIGAACGFLAFSFVQWAFRMLRGYEGLGGGDAKLLAVGGAWCGWQGLAPIVLIASFAGLIVAVPLALKSRSARTAIAFGPFLALGIWLVWLARFKWPGNPP